MKTFTRSQLARICGVGPETIRFYEKQGLLPPPPRSAAGYRRFGEDSVHRLNFIRRAKELGFSLNEIAELLALHDDEHGDRAQVKAMTEAKLDEIVAKIRDLQRMREVLAHLAAECSGAGPVSGCPIIHALADDDSEIELSVSNPHERHHA
jgi:Hg(II)-responsive transcriptional regulator